MQSPRDVPGLVARSDLRDLRRFFQSRVSDGATDDLVQESMLAALRGFRRAPSGLEFRAYLFGVARFKVMRHMRERQSQVLRSLPHLEQSTRFRSPDAQLDLESVLAQLPPALQLVVHMTFWGGLSPNEIAELLSVPLPTVYTRLRRAKQRVAYLLPP